MTDLATVLNALRRPKILIRAARAGVVDYRRDRDLKRLLRQPRGTAPTQAIGSLLAEESRLEDDPHRRRGHLLHPAPRRGADRDPRRGAPARRGRAAGLTTRRNHRGGARCRPAASGK